MLHTVEIPVHVGELFVFNGSVACAKSMPLNLITGLDEITSGGKRNKAEVVNRIPAAVSVGDSAVLAALRNDQGREERRAILERSGALRGFMASPSH